MIMSRDGTSSAVRGKVVTRYHGTETKVTHTALAESVACVLADFEQP